MLGSKMNKCVIFSAFFVVFCLKVGLTSSCTQESFKDGAKLCVHKLYSALKQDPKQDCRALYARLKTCFRNIVDECRNKTDSKNLTQIISTSKRIITVRKYYCEDGMLNSFKGYTELPDCRERALKKVKKCAESFHREFRENRGSRSLCRKFSKAKQCVKKTLGKFCRKTEQVQNLLKPYQDAFNPYCPGMVDAKRTPVKKSLLRPFGSCSQRDYLILSRVCLTSFVHTLQKDPKKSCRLVFMNKLHNCAKDIALHCHKNESDYTKRSIERSYAQKSYITYQKQKFCNGINFQLSYPSGILKGNQCKKNYIAAKHNCEASYIATYKENKADKTLCRKYAEAKHCVKNATLVLCKVTPGLRDEINFIYDGFNPFCFNLFDPPIVEAQEIAGRVTRESGNQRPMEPSDPTGGSSNIPTGGGGQSVSIKHLGFVVGLSLLVLMWAVS